MSANIDKEISSIKVWLVQWIAQYLKIQQNQIDADSSSFFYFGLDSTAIAEFLHDIEKKYNITCDSNTLYEMNSLHDIAMYIANNIPTTEHSSNTTPTRSIDSSTHSTEKFKNIYFNINEGISTNTTVIDKIKYINFSGYNYLGLSGHSNVTEAVIAAVKEYGTSVSASRLVSGEKSLHRTLEKAIAKLIGAEDAVVFPSGYATNITTITHLYHKGDLIIHDALIHNSIKQGAIYSGATRLAFPHNDYLALENILKQYRHQFKQVLIVSEGIFSMDGDIPDVTQLVTLKKNYDAHLMLDEAHSMGTLGPRGFGVSEYFGINANDIDIWMGTLSKAFASCGGYIAGTHSLIQNIKFGANGFIFSVGISPANTAAAYTAIELMKKEPERVKTLQKRGQLFLSLLKDQRIPMGKCMNSPIIPVIVGDEARVISLHNALKKQAIYVLPIIYPAVQKGSERLRFFVNCLHTEQQIYYAADAVAKHYSLLTQRSDHGTY